MVNGGVCGLALSSGKCEQAVAEGDAMKADKRRKKKMQEMEQAADPIFGGSDESDGGDYIPGGVEEPEYIEAGADQEEEAADEETVNDLLENGNGQDKASRKRILEGTGESASRLRAVPALFTDFYQSSFKSSLSDVFKARKNTAACEQMFCSDEHLEKFK